MNDDIPKLERLSLMEAELVATTGTLKNCMDSLFTVEAERDKLIEVNKVLVDALIRLDNVTQRFELTTPDEYDAAVNAKDGALKLAGEIK